MKFGNEVTYCLVITLLSFIPRETHFGHAHSLFLQARHYPDPDREEQGSPQAAVSSTPPPSRFVSATVSPPSAEEELMLRLVAGSMGRCLRVVTHLGQGAGPTVTEGAYLCLSAAGALRRQAPHTRAVVMFHSP